jgi:hypothetical protein
VWCERTGTPQQPFPAEWEKYGDAAGFLRNQQMVDEAGIQLLIAFPGGDGTRDMMNRCLFARIPVKQIEARKDDRTSGEQKPAAEGETGQLQHDPADIAHA